MLNADRPGKEGLWLAHQRAMCRSSGVMLFFGSGESGKTTFASGAVQSALIQQNNLDRDFSAELMPLESASAFLSAWLSPSLIKEFARTELIPEEEFESNISHFMRAVNINGSALMEAIGLAFTDGARSKVDAFTFALATFEARLRRGSNVAPLQKVASAYFHRGEGFFAMKEHANDEGVPANVELDSANEFGDLVRGLGNDFKGIKHLSVAVDRLERASCVVLDFGAKLLVSSKEMGVALVENDAAIESFARWALRTQSDDVDLAELGGEFAGGAGTLKQAVASLAAVSKLLSVATEGEKREIKASEKEFSEILSLGTHSPAGVAKLSALIDQIPSIALHEMLSTSGLYHYVLVTSPGFETAVANLARWFGTATGLYSTALLARTELKDEGLYRCFVYNDSLENTFANIRILSEQGDIRIYTKASLLSLVFGAMLIFRVIHFSAIDKTAARSIQVESAIQSGGLDSQILNATQNLSDFAAQMGVLVVAELRDDFTAGADVSLARAKLGANSRFAIHVTRPEGILSPVGRSIEQQNGGRPESRNVWVRTKAYFPEEESGTFIYTDVTLRDVQQLADREDK